MGQILMYVAIVLSLISYTNGDALDTYKWKSIVDDQLPSVSQACGTAFGSRFDTEATFYDLLYHDPKSRGRMCGVLMPDNQDFVECSPVEEEAIENLMCYEYDVNDDSTPPISKTCAMRYWECSQVQEFFFDLLSREQRETVCAEKDYYMSCDTKSRSSPFCHITPSEICDGFDLDPKMKSFFVSTGCNTNLQMCFLGEYAVVYRLLREMKNSMHQLYLCGRLEECLVKSSYMHEGVKCSRGEASALDEFLCSNTIFTPDMYGLFMLDEKCRDSFYHCFNQTSITDLQTDHIGRKTLCQTRFSYDSCYSYFRLDCSHEQIDIINDFLCYDLNDAVLLVSKPCKADFVQCIRKDGIPLDGISDLEMLDHGFGKYNICETLPMLWACVEQDLGCSEHEKKYLQKYVCDASGTPCNIHPSALITGLVLFLALTAWPAMIVYGN